MDATTLQELKIHHEKIVAEIRADECRALGKQDYSFYHATRFKLREHERFVAALDEVISTRRCSHS